MLEDEDGLLNCSVYFDRVRCRLLGRASQIVLCLSGKFARMNDNVDGICEGTPSGCGSSTVPTVESIGSTIFAFCHSAFRSLSFSAARKLTDFINFQTPLPFLLAPFDISGIKGCLWC